jgi:hypothetical protein
LKKISSTPGISASSPYAGAWTLAEIKQLNESKQQVEDALKAVRAKLGDAWKLEIDYKAFDAGSVGNSYRSDTGRYIHGDIVKAFADNDVAKWDEDVAEAINDAVGDKQVVNITFDKAEKRADVTVNPDNGVKIVFSKDYFAYTYDADYVNKWVLDNC